MNSVKLMMLMKNKPFGDWIFRIHSFSEIFLLMQSWESLGVTFKEPPGESPEGEEEQWKWMWRGSFFNPVKLGRLFGKELPNNLLYNCMKANLLYPDGTSAMHRLNEMLKAKEKEENENAKEG